MPRSPLARTLITLACLALTAPAMAQQPYAGPPGGARSYAPPGPPSPAFIEQRLASLRSRLMLGPEQEAAWQPFEEAMRQQAQQMQAVTAAMSQPRATAPERFSQMAQAMQQGAAGMANVAQALASLYLVLSPGQRSTIESEFPPQPGPGQAPGAPPMR